MVAGGIHGCQGACMVAGGVCGCRGMHGCGEHAWLLGGKRGCCGACMVAGGVHGCGGHVWLQGACVVVGGMSGCGVCAWDMMRYGQLAGGTHPTGMHSFLCNGFEFRDYFCKQHIVLNHVF